jgi:hypothetical protein
MDEWIYGMGDEPSRSSLHDSNTPLLRRLDVVPKVGIAPTSPPLQGGANLPQLLGEIFKLPLVFFLEFGIWSFRRLVVPAGNAPASSGYQPDALLLSYRTVLILWVNSNFWPRFRLASF